MSTLPIPETTATPEPKRASSWAAPLRSIGGGCLTMVFLLTACTLITVGYLLFTCTAFC